MKRFFLFFLLLLVPQFSYGWLSNGRSNQHKSIAEEPSTVLLCYPRSGCHWLTYCLYRLVDQHILDYNKEWPPMAQKFLPELAANPRATRTFCRAHTVRDTPSSSLIKRPPGPKPFYGVTVSREVDTLVLLLRDYKECYPRHLPNISLLSLPQRDPSYFKNLELYHNWPAERRYLVYYEDLIQDLEGTLRDLLGFLGEPTGGIPEFLARSEDHKKFVINLYDNVHGSQSKGEDLHHHAKKIDPKLLQQFDELIITRYPHLFPYLERYLGNIPKRDSI